MVAVPFPSEYSLPPPTCMLLRHGSSLDLNKERTSVMCEVQPESAAAEVEGISLRLSQERPPNSSNGDGSESAPESLSSSLASLAFACLAGASRPTELSRRGLHDAEPVPRGAAGRGDVRGDVL